MIEDRGRLLILLVAALSACATHERSIDVIALNGDRPQPLAVVVAHRPDGSILNTSQVDASGRAKPVLEDDSLVSVIFPPDQVGTRIYTVAVAGLDGELTIHAPPEAPSYSPVGRLDVTAAPYASADEYEVMVASGTLRMTQLPASMDFDATSIGVDSMLPVIVTARAADSPIAYAAGKVAIENGVATFSASTWLPVTPNITLQSTDPTTQIDVTLVIDGLEFGAPLAIGGALHWEGLGVDHTTIHAERGSGDALQDTTRELDGAPSAITFDDSDFLPTIDPTLTFTGLPIKAPTAPPLHASWNGAEVTADAVALFMGYITKVYQTTVVWTVVLAPDATEITTPHFEGAFEAFAPRDVPSNLLQWIDSPDLVGFDAARRAGIYALSASNPGTIVPEVSTGEIRQSAIAWYGP